MTPTRFLELGEVLSLGLAPEGNWVSGPWERGSGRLNMFRKCSWGALSNGGIVGTRSGHLRGKMTPTRFGRGGLDALSPCAMHRVGALGVRMSLLHGF